VLEFIAGNGFSDGFVALEAQIVSRNRKVEFIVRRMRVVAFHAISFYGNFVNASCLLRDDPVVARVANFTRILGQELAVG
jgi:hypothetical protein